MIFFDAMTGSQLWGQWWFAPACVLAGAAIGLGLHVLRLHQMSVQLRERFEERLSARIQVDQELHDALLQGVLSASMQLHVAIDQLPDDSPALPAMNHVLQLMGRVADDGRNTLQGLRSSIDSSHDLTNSLAQIPEQVDAGKVDFRVVVEGSSVPLRPLVRDDVYRIVREAIVNAVRHSQAKTVSLRMMYAPSQLRISVVDDGRGIDPASLQSGRKGRWGLPGMRKQAEKIGGGLKVWSRAGKGTEVELRLPGNIAFEERPSGPDEWMRDLHWRQKEVQSATKPEGDK